MPFQLGFIDIDYVITVNLITGSNTQARGFLSVNHIHPP